MMTLEQLMWVIDPAPRGCRLAEVYPFLAPTAAEFDISTELREAAWLAQVAHESARFRALEEFATGANYEGRQDLGNTQPGDGVRFKGRGLIQVTGRYNYATYGQEVYGDPTRFIVQPPTLALPPDATRSAGWFWRRRGLNELADQADFYTITKKINGGLNGWEDRLHLFKRAGEVYGFEIRVED